MLMLLDSSWTPDLYKIDSFCGFAATLLHVIKGSAQAIVYSQWPYETIIFAESCKSKYMKAPVEVEKDIEEVAHKGWSGKGNGVAYGDHN